METIHVRTRSDANGILHLDIPVNQLNAEFDITVTLDPISPEAHHNDNSEAIIKDQESYEDLDDLLCD